MTKKKRPTMKDSVFPVRDRLREFLRMVELDPSNEQLILHHLNNKPSLRICDLQTEVDTSVPRDKIEETLKWFDRLDEVGAFSEPPNYLEQLDVEPADLDAAKWDSKKWVFTHTNSLVAALCARARNFMVYSEWAHYFYGSFSMLLESLAIAGITAMISEAEQLGQMDTASLWRQVLAANADIDRVFSLLPRSAYRLDRVFDSSGEDDNLFEQLRYTCPNTERARLAWGIVESVSKAFSARAGIVIEKTGRVTFDAAQKAADHTGIAVAQAISFHTRLVLDVSRQACEAGKRKGKTQQRIAMRTRKRKITKIELIRLYRAERQRKDPGHKDKPFTPTACCERLASIAGVGRDQVRNLLIQYGEITPSKRPRKSRKNRKI
ncbi:MAG: hypothetical protein WC708_21450 [Lentisphaeria bacterium]